MSGHAGTPLAADSKSPTSAKHVARADVWDSTPRTIHAAALAAAMAISALLVTPAWSAAQAHVGVRGGISVAPAVRIPNVTAQLYVGAHVETQPLVGRLLFRPNVEAGFGDGLVVAAINGEFVWRFPPMRSGWSAYAGAGPTFNLFRFGTDRFGQREAEMVAGIGFLGGFESRSGVFFEVKLGVLDRPDIARSLLDGVEELKVAVGYTWK